MQLRAYQQKTINDLYAWMENHSGNPCAVLSTGSGKSVIIAELCRDIISSYSGVRVLMLTHVKELIEQNYEKLITLWPNAPAGIYSASVGHKDINQPITFAGIQSIAKKIDLYCQYGNPDIVIVDECHLVNHKDEGNYRKVINNLLSKNKHMRVIGFTATPYRLGHGVITDDPAIFDDIIEPVTIEELQASGYLSKLKSKFTNEKLSTDGVHKRGGEYIESELQAVVDKDDKNIMIVDEVINRSEGRKHWLFFCTGVNHARHISEILNARGIKADYITGKHTKAQRESIINDFKSGNIQALTNAEILTTGFDFPDIDLIALCRPTLSPVLYIQMVGRGLRVKSHINNCLVLDFAGLIETHGPITNVQKPTKKGEGGGPPPMKECPDCMEIVHASLKKCYECGYDFPCDSIEHDIRLRNDDINGQLPDDLDVTFCRIEKKKSKKTNIDMFHVIYYGKTFDQPINEFICPFHPGYAGIIGKRLCKEMSIDVDNIKILNRPTKIKYKKDGKYYKIIGRYYDNKEKNAVL